MLMTWPQILTMMVAVVGAVLGIVNTWFAFDKNRVKLRVSPYTAVLAQNGKASAPFLAIQITNLSSFPVTIADVGLRLTRAKKHIMLLNPIILDGKPWPRRLDARDACVVYFNSDLASNPELRFADRAYAHTVCGTKAYGGSDDLKKYVRESPQQAR